MQERSMAHLKKIQFSDLLLLRDLFCGRDKSFYIYDPLHCITGNARCIDISKIKDKEASIIFNFSYDLFPGDAEAEYIFHFNIRKEEVPGQFYYINNPDGSMRWVYPSTSARPYFLELYNSGTLKGSIFRYLVKIAYNGGMKERICSGSFFLQQKSKNKVEQVIADSGEVDYSIFTGTKGENRKSIIGLHRQNQTTHFIKVAFNEQPQQLIKNEIQMLTTLSKYDFTALSLPQPSIAIDPSFVKMTNVKPAAIISANRLRDVHIKALAELYLTNNEKRKIKNTPAWETISNQLCLLDKEHEILNNLDHTVVYNIIQKLFALHNSVDTEAEIPVSFAHGDFTPWNMYTDDHRLYVYDWELAGAGMPMLFDLFHFIFQSQVLLFRKDFSAISKSMSEALRNKLAEEIIKRYKINTDLHYKLYLLFNISYYIRLYMHQTPLHAQAHWLVNTWHQALNEIN
jgi:thiamine kinase-like enzyme